MARLLGADPGLTGAVALWDTTTGELIVHDMPVGAEKTTTGKVRNELNEAALASIIHDLKPDRALIEKVGAMPGNGSVSMFRFGMTFGVLRGVLAACHVPVDFMRPQEWQKSVRLPLGDDAAILRASQLFPKYASYFRRKMDHGRADATLLAYALSLMSPKRR